MIVLNLINRFLKRNKKTLNSTNIIFEMNGVILVESGDKDFDFKSTVINEVQKYCDEYGIINIDKVVIISVYDADLHNLNKKHVFDQRTTSKSESKIVVIEEDGQRIAQVFFSEYVEIQGDN